VTPLWLAAIMRVTVPLALLTRADEVIE